MKYYLVSQKELCEAVEHFEDSNYSSIAYVERLIKNKKPVTEIFKGKPVINDDEASYWNDEFEKALLKTKCNGEVILLEVQE